MAKRKSKIITNKDDLDEILSLTTEKAKEKSLIMDWFCDFGKGSRFNVYDIITVPKNTYGTEKMKNKESFVTTLGLWVFNKSFIEQFVHILGYINKPIDGDVYEDINNTLSYALLEKKITLDQLKDFIMQTQILMGCTSAISASHTMDMLLITDKAKAKKAQLEKKYAEGIKNGDLKQIKDIEDEMVQWAKEELKDSESADMYNSKARGKWGNNFKNMYLLKGPVKHTDGSYSYIGSSHIEGIKKEEYSASNDSAIGGPYARARKTQSGGYMEKQFTAATQHIKVLPPGSDCGSKHTITITLTKKNINMWMYSFVVTNGGKLVEITSENKDSFIGKTVKLRYSSLCKAKNGYICEKCAGTLYNRVGIQNVGLGCMIMMSSLKNASMKAFHDSTLNMAKIDPNKVFNIK